MERGRCNMGTEINDFTSKMLDMEFVELEGFKFYIRKDSSDESILDDNIVRKVILKHLSIDKDSCWIDCGGYIGTFSALLASKGAKVFAVEADPLHVTLYKLNMNLNGYQDNIICCGLVDSDSSRLQYMTVNVKKSGKGLNVAANTLITKWKTERPTFPVYCIKLTQLLQIAENTLGESNNWNIKFDIEGSEIPILEEADFSKFKQMYIEYHFNADRSIDRAEKVIARLKEQGFTVYQNHKLPNVATWDWFPATLVLWCKREN
jgi:FkbM family methyltransferase